LKIGGLVFFPENKADNFIFFFFWDKVKAEISLQYKRYKRDKQREKRKAPTISPKTPLYTTTKNGGAEFRANQRPYNLNL
jgi:hypothetical protein